MNHLEAAAHWAWDTSLAASILIIPALLFSLLFRHPRFTPIRHMLGLLIVARLLLPVSLPSPLSIFNLLKPQPTAQIPIAPLSPPTIVEVEVTRLTSPAQNQSLLTSPATRMWILGLAILLTRVVVQHIKVRRWLTANNRITEGPAVEALNTALTLSNCRRRVALYSINGLSTPALFGLFHPAILLPADLARSTDLTRLRLVCLHEIAHLQRMDVLINWLMIIAQSLHWFNPLVWLTLRRLRADQELLCDEAVMRVLRPEEHRTYGETLLALASPRAYRFSTLIPVSSNFKQLKERIAMIKQFKPATRRILVFTLPPLAALLAMLTFTAATQKKLTPAPVQPEVAGAESAKKAEQSIKNLQNQFENADEQVQMMEDRINSLRRELRISALTEANLLNEPETVRRIEQDRIRAEQEYRQYNELLSSLKKKNRSELLHAIPTAYRDESLGGLLEKLQKTEQELALLQVDYASDHPDVKRQERLLKLIDRQIDDRIKGVIGGLESLVAARKAIVEELKNQLTEMKVSEAQSMERARPYFKARRDLEIHQRLRDSLYARLLEEKSNQRK